MEKRGAGLERCFLVGAGSTLRISPVVFLPAFFSKVKTDLLDLHIVRSAVWLGDQDPMGHMTNSRYSSFTDLAIMNYMGRTGALKAFRKRGWLK